MKIVDVVKQRVQKFLFKQLKKKGYNFSDAPDSRQQGKITHSIGSIIWASLLGLMANKKTLRDVEEMTQNLNEMASKLYQERAALEACVDGGKKPATLPLVEPLSERELEVLRLVSAGLSNREIAEKLVISKGTAKSHVHNICGKLGVRNRTEAASRAKVLGLV